MVVIFVSLYSCSDEEANSLNIEQEQSKVLSLKEYVEFLKADYPGGKVLIESNLPISVKSSPEYINIRKSLNESDEEVKFSLVESKSKSQFKSDSKNSLFNVFGSTINFNIGNNLKATSSSTSSVYIPELLEAQISTPDLRTGTVLTWNVDQQNENGLVLWFEYSPYNQTNYDVVDQNREIIAGGLTIPDSGGTYVVKLEDIEAIPDDANVNFYLSRAGIGVSSSSDSEVTAITGMTTVTGELKVINEEW